jgi:hypothetical protein
MARQRKTQLPQSLTLGVIAQQRRGIMTEFGDGVYADTAVEKHRPVAASQVVQPKIGREAELDDVALEGARDGAAIRNLVRSVPSPPGKSRALGRNRMSDTSASPPSGGLHGAGRGRGGEDRGRQRDVADLDRRIAQIDHAVDKAADSGKSRSAMDVAPGQKAKNRATLVAEHERALSELATLKAGRSTMAARHEVDEAAAVRKFRRAEAGHRPGEVLALDRFHGAADQ